MPSAGGDLTDELGGEQKKINFAMRHVSDDNPEFQAEFYIGYNNHVADESFLHPQFVAGNSNLNSSDVVRDFDIKEDNLNLGVDITTSRWDGHKIMASVQALKNWMDWDARGVALTPVPSKQNRFHWSTSLQDEFTLNNGTMVTTGIRYDHYDQNAGGHLSPRLAFAHQLYPEHLIKAQYSHNVRPLSRDEAEAGIRTPQSADTVEFGYIYRSPKAVGRVTLFHAWHHNINGVASGVDNDGTLLGLEANGGYTLNKYLKLDTRLSWKTPRGDGVMNHGKSVWFSDVGLNIIPKQDWWLNLRLTHEEDSTAYSTTTKLTAIKKNFLYPNLELKGRIKKPGIITRKRQYRSGL
ncbi:MAG: TonB-dependent receptor [Magnetococcales bacterium]|nr:TonB-dependent receptor [Magnetococcales bacterium]